MKNPSFGLEIGHLAFGFVRCIAVFLLNVALKSLTIDELGIVFISQRNGSRASKQNNQQLRTGHFKVGLLEIIVESKYMGS